MITWALPRARGCAWSGVPHLEVERATNTRLDYIQRRLGARNAGAVGVGVDRRDADVGETMITWAG